MIQSCIRRVGGEHRQEAQTNPFANRFKFSFTKEFDLFKPQREHTPHYKSFSELRAHARNAKSAHQLPRVPIAYENESKV